jgi:hypothetical protein
VRIPRQGFPTNADSALPGAGGKRPRTFSNSTTSPAFPTEHIHGISAPERGPRSEKPLNDRAVDDHTSRPELRPVQSGEKTVIDQGQNLEFLPELRPIPFEDGISCPLVHLSIPERTVIIGDRRDAAEDIVRPKSIGYGREETGALRILALQRPVDGDEDSFHRAREAVVGPCRDVSEERA